VTAVETPVLLELAARLKARVGLHVRTDSLPALRLALLARLEQLGAAVDGAPAYLARLDGEQGDDELRALLPLVTVGKTHFFRDQRQFDALAALLPGLLARARAGGPPARIWSAGCATGEEAWSIAMAAAEAGAAPGELELVATDINPEAVAAATRGLYEPRRGREVPPELLARHFDVEEGHFRVRPALRRWLAAIYPHNLSSASYPAPATGHWDLVFCRNVIIYFDQSTTRQVLTRLLASLEPGGTLFLGYSESLFRLFEGFDLVEVAGAFLYRKPEAGAAPPVAPSVGSPAAPPGPPHHHHLPPPTVRHLALAAPPRAAPPRPPGRPSPEAAAPAPPPAPRGPSALSPQEFLDGAASLIAEGRFGPARELLERAMEQGDDDLAVRLTLANLQGILRQPGEARAAYLAALALEPLSAEAHLFYGIHLFTTGEADEAALELSRALFVDPDLVVGHYYLGRCREGQRDPARARLAYRNAIEAHLREPRGRRQAFLGYYPDVPEDGAAFARAAEYALTAL